MSELTVLMAVRNGEPYLQAAVESILSQTWGDFTFLVIDDASTDKTPEIIRSYGDRRIQLLCLDKNIGQTAALNRGLEETKTEWIARMDADDYSAPKRFELQMQAAKADRTLGCIGTYAWTFEGDPAHVEGKLLKPVGSGAIRSALLWSSPIIHGSMIARTRDMTEAGGYNERYRYSADLDLYDRLLSRCAADNVPELLLGIRRHPGQDSHSAKAIRESIEIFNHRLTQGTYSPKEVAVVRAGKHLHEALCASIESRYLDTLGSVASAFWFSPSLTLAHFIPRRFRTA
jgi:glycosyltransferase involved in cell wall biosynthesis